MADDPHALRRIDWEECCRFVRLFRIFRLAINHRNLLLLLLGFSLTCLVGHAMDRLWQWGGHESEVGIFAEATETMQYFGARAVAASLHGQLVGHGSGVGATTHPLDAGGYGVIDSLFGIAQAKLSLARNHPVYAGIFGLVMLAIWSLLGGAVCRIIAVDAARDEKISLGEALGFARQNYWNFLVAPLIPYGMVIGIGIFLLVGGLVGGAPVLDIISGLFFFLALIGGFMIALAIIGTVVGTCLMFPTIAVEGSDAFDAISRSFSYVFTRPWHTVLYASVAVVYGAVCYLFARLVVWLLLVATHVFVGAGMTGFGLWNQRGDGIGKLDVMWQMPTFASLTPQAATDISGTESFASHLIAFWVWIVIGLLYAFVASMAMSGATMIYYLLRHDTDATDYEDVYMDEEEQEDLLAAPSSTIGQVIADEQSPTDADNADSDESAKPGPDDSEDPGA